MRKIVRDRILNKCNYKCVKCNSKENLEIDHIIPLSRGGRGDEDNMQVLCKKCNRSKKNKIDFKGYIKLTKKGDILINENFFIKNHDKTEIINFIDTLHNNYKDMYPFYKATGKEKINLYIR